MEQQAGWKRDIREGSTTAFMVVVGAGIYWLGYALGYPTMGAIVGLGVIVDHHIKKAWRKTIRPAIIELIREALR